jgi:hypothetical protein
VDEGGERYPSYSKLNKAKHWAAWSKRQLFQRTRLVAG